MATALTAPLPGRFNCPLTGVVCESFPSMNVKGKFGIGKHMSAGWMYLNSKLEWSSTPHHYDTKEQADATFLLWVECEVVADAKSSQFGLKDVTGAVIPDLIDFTKMRFKFRCPSCSRSHVSQIGLRYWDDLGMFVQRRCPKTPTTDPAKFFVQLRKYGAIDPAKYAYTCATGDILECPRWDCKECFATGEYVGFMSVSRCGSCLPKS
jgi:hypothetical protein